MADKSSPTRTFQLNKLVRDTIVKQNLDHGYDVDWQVLDGSELKSALIDKLLEEVRELQATKDLSIEELADIQEIVDTLLKELGSSYAELKSAQDKKRTKNGGFQNGDYVSTITLPANSEWAHYYASDPDRFIEITEEK